MFNNSVVYNPFQSILLVIDSRNIGLHLEGSELFDPLGIGTTLEAFYPEGITCCFVLTC